MPYDKNTPHVMIPLSERHFELLSRWASVGRTIDAAMYYLVLYHHSEPNPSKAEEAEHTVNELLDLKQALDECNASCKMVRMDAAYEAKKQDREVGKLVADIDKDIPKQAEFLTNDEIKHIVNAQEHYDKRRLSQDK